MQDFVRNWNTFWGNVGWHLGPVWNAIGGWTGFCSILLLVAMVLVIWWTFQAWWHKSPEKRNTCPLPVVTAKQIAAQFKYDAVKQAGGWRKNKWRRLSRREQYKRSGVVPFPYEYDAAEEFDAIVADYLTVLGWDLQEQEQERGEM